MVLIGALILLKPFEKDELLKTVSRVLERVASI